MKVILYAEDDPTDVFFFKRAAIKFADEVDFRIVPDGDVAIEWLSGEGPYADRARYPLPDMLITDLKMPHCSGFEVLQFVRGHPKFKKLPVVVYTSSDLDTDIARARDLEVTDYLTKDWLCVSLVKYLRRYLDAFTAADAKGSGIGSDIGAAKQSSPARCSQ